MKTADELIELIALNESRNTYSKWNPDDNGQGVSFGLIQFNQKKGTLPMLLKRMHSLNQRAFFGCFWDYWELMLDTAWVRKADLKPLRPMFQHSATIEEFRQAQRDLAREQYLEPAYKLANAWGHHSERAVAMFFDIMVQYGRAGLVKMIEKAMDPMTPAKKSELGKLADYADKHDYDASRRHHIYYDKNLSDKEWSLE